MKPLRLWFLVLLAALLPLRGAMAAAMLCPAASAGTHAEMRSTGQEPAAHDHRGEAHAHHQHDAGQAHDPRGMSDEDRCNLCSAFCSQTPMPSEVVGIAEPGDLVDPPFPMLPAPAPSFLSDGQERPPRSI